MLNTWASGAAELMWHAQSHLDYDSAFDNRIAFVSIDNAVELTLRTFLDLPSRCFRNAAPTRSEVDRASGKFPILIELVARYGEDRLGDFDLDKLEAFHRIRNRLYHQGTGFDVDRRYLIGYFEIARDLLKKLLDVELPGGSPVLNDLRADVLQAVSAELKERDKTSRSARIQAGLARVAEEGRPLGRGRKVISPEERQLIADLYADGWGADSIATEITARRGAHLLTDLSARRREGISKSAIRRHLLAEGLLEPGRKNRWGKGPKKRG